MHCAFNQLVFPNSMFTPLLLLFFIERAMCSPEKEHLKITIIIIINVTFSLLPICNRQIVCGSYIGV